jgi:hypothetical protein
VIAWFWLPRHLKSAWFLTPEEREWAVERIARDSGGQDYQAPGITWQDAKDALKDWKLCMLSIFSLKLGLILWVGITSGIQQSGFGVFLPLIVQQLGYQSFYANLYAVPIYVVGAVGLWLSRCQRQL